MYRHSRQHRCIADCPSDKCYDLRRQNNPTEAQKGPTLPLGPSHMSRRLSCNHERHPGTPKGQPLALRWIFQQSHVEPPSRTDLSLEHLQQSSYRCFEDSYRQSGGICPRCVTASRVAREVPDLSHAPREKRLAPYQRSYCSEIRRGAFC